MIINTRKTAARAYQAPDCCASEVLEGAIICESGYIEDWGYDDDIVDGNIE